MIDDEEAKEILVLAGQIVRAVVKRTGGSTVWREQEDLVQAAAVGILLAIESYNPSKDRGSGLRAYAARYGLGEVYHYLRDKLFLVKTPRKMSDARQYAETFSLDALEEDDDGQVNNNRMEHRLVDQESGYGDVEMDLYLDQVLNGSAEIMKMRTRGWKQYEIMRVLGMSQRVASIREVRAKETLRKLQTEARA